MNDNSGFDRAVAQWLDDGSDATPPAVIDAVLLAARSTPQERDFRILWRTASNRFGSRTFAAAVSVVAAAVLAGLVIGQALVGNSALRPTIGSTPLPSPTLAERWDPTYEAWSIESRPGVLVAREPTSAGTDFVPFDNELRGEWVDGKLCYTVQSRRSEGRNASGNCATWDELVNDPAWAPGPAATGPMRAISHLGFGLGGERIYEWAVLSPDVARVEMTLVSGEVVVPELFEMPIGPNGERVRWIWLRTLSPVRDVVPVDADGQRVESGP